MPPNILWICTDQQRLDTLGCEGNEFVRTPNIDSLSAQGVLFDHAYCQSPVCTPSRVSFLTGRYPVTAHGRQNGADIPSSERLVTKILQENGYYCGLSGKLHLSACNPQSGRAGVERRIDDGYSVFHWSHDPSGFWGNMNEYRNWLSERGRSFDTPEHPRSRWVRQGMPSEYHQTTWCTQHAVDFIHEQAASHTPWLFSVNMYDPHHPFDPPAEYLDRYIQRLHEIPLPNYRQGEENTKTIWQRIDHAGAYGQTAGFPYPDMTETDHRMVRAAYWAMCDLIDSQVGRMLEALQETGQREDTIVIFMSDHGEMLGDHGIYLKGPFFYEPAVRVPLMMSWPGVITSGRRNAMVELMDLPQTLLELCGIAAPEAMQGRSFASLLRAGGADEHKTAVYSEYYNAMPWHRDPLAFATMIRTATEKLVVAHGTGEGELYDLSEDPGENINRWTEPAYQGRKADLIGLAMDRMASTIDPVPGRIAPW